MNILITGSEGFVGHHVAEHFCEQGYNVIGVDNLIKYGKIRENLRKYKNYFFHNIDLLNDLPWKVATLHPHIIIDMASIVGGINAFNTQYIYDDMVDNIRMYNKVLRIAKNAYKDNHLKRLINISSSIIYEHCDNEVEDQEIKPPTHPYGYYKYTCEYLTKQANIPYTICRLYNAVGTGDDNEKYSHVFSDFARQLNRTGNINISNNTIRTFIDCKEIAKSLQAIIENISTINKTYNICSDYKTKISELARELIEIKKRMVPFGKFDWHYIENKNKIDIPKMVGNNTKLSTIYCPKSYIDWKAILEYYV